MKKRIFCLLFFVLMVCSMLPVAAASPMVVLEYPPGILYEENGYTVTARVLNGSGNYSYRWQAGYDKWSGSGMTWLDLEDNITYHGTHTDTFTFTTREGQGGNWNTIYFRCVVTDSSGKEYASAKYEIPEPVPKQELTVIIFYGLEKPTYGNVPDYTAQTPAVTQYSPGQIQWYRTFDDIPANRMSRDETVTAGKYCVRVYINPTSSWKVSPEANCGLFNGDDRLLFDEYGDPYVKGFWDVTEPTSAGILKEPASVTVSRGETATLQVKAEHVSAYQWQCLNDNKYWIDLTPDLAGSLHVGGASTDTLTWSCDKYTREVFRCKITGNDSAVSYTSAASITVGGNPIIKEQPEIVPFRDDGAAEIIISGENVETASFTFLDGSHEYKLEALKDAFPGIQYTKTVSTDGTTVQLKLSNLPNAFQGVMGICTIENAIGKATGGLMKFVRYPEVPAILKQPEDRYVYPGQANMTLRVNASGSELKFEWEVKVSDRWYPVSSLPEYFTGANTDTLRATPALLANAETVLPNFQGFQCAVSNRSASIGTRTAQLFLTTEPEPCTGGDSCPGQAFGDMPPVSDWSHGGIDFCLTHKLFSGVSTTSFAPNGPMTRSMLVSVLWRLDWCPKPAGTAHFDDVGPSTWYSDAVAWAAENGIVSGVGGNRFNPDGNVTREQIAVIFYNYANYRNYRTGAWKDMSEFGDADKVNDYADIGMSWAIAEGLISGIPSGDGLILNPLGNASRAQVASIVRRFCQSFFGY